jgi:Protein of unknown function (DUF2752)
MTKFIRNKLNTVILIIMALSITTFYFFWNPTEHKTLLICPFYSLTDFYCPGCGGQRAFHAFLHGHFIEAFHDNLLIFVIIPAVLYKIFLNLNDSLQKDVFILQSKWIWIFLSFLMLFTILRNVPFPPFNQLIPTN